MALVIKNLHDNAGDARDVAFIPGSGRSPGVGNGTPSSILAILAGKILLSEELNRLQSMALPRVGHD